MLYAITGSDIITVYVYVKTVFWTSCFLLCCSTNLESYTYCYQSFSITWLFQTSSQNSLILCLTI